MTGVRFRMEGAYFKFKPKLGLLSFICNIKKYHELQHKNIHLAMYVYTEPTESIWTPPVLPVLTRRLMAEIFRSPSANFLDREF